MQNNYYITDKMTSRGGYKASRENIRIFRSLQKGKIIDLNLLDKSFVNQIKFKIYKLTNFIINLLFYKGIPLTLPQYFHLINIDKNTKNIFYIHYANQIFNFNLIKKHKNSKFVFFIYDEWLINGLSHFQNQSNNIILRTIEEIIYKKKINLLNQKNVFLLASTEYLKNKCKKIFFKKKIYKFNYPSDVLFWRRVNEKKSKKKLFLEEDKKYILFVARGGTDNFRKGGFYLKKILKKYHKNKNIKFLILGQYYSNDIKLKFNNVEFINLNDDYLLKYLYSSVKINLTLSIYENLPYSIIESMSCGVINVAFDTGGIKEIIDHKKNGWIAKKNNVNSICEGINWALKNEKKFKSSSRKKIVSNLHVNVINKKAKLIKKELNFINH